MSEGPEVPEARISALHRTLGIRVSFGPNREGRAAVTVDPDVHYGARFAHGGVVATLADIAGAVAISVRFPNPMKVIDGTIELKINYLRKVLEGDIVATATPVHIGHRIGVSDVDVHNGDRLVAKALVTYMIDPEAGEPQR